MADETKSLPKPIFERFHRLWTWAVGKQDYNKSEWKGLELELERLRITDEQVAAKQARAEVLAAQLKLADKWKKGAEEFDWPTKENICRCCLIMCAEELRKLQPAASALEALLREERDEALLNIVAWRRDLLEAWRTDSRAWMTALVEGGPNMDIEKARATIERKA